MRFALLPVLVLLSACSVRPVTTSVPGYPDHTAKQILARLPDAPPELDELYAVAEVSVASPDESGRFTARISYRKQDSMLVRVRFPLGVEGARVLVTADSAFVYDRMENTLIMGTPDQISSALPVAVAGTDLVALATGFLQPDPSTAWIVTADNTLYELRSPDGRQRWLIDPREWRVVHAEYRNADGALVEQRWYASFGDMSGVRIPRRVSVSHPLEDTRLVMALSRLNTSPPPLSFALDVRSDTKRYVLR